jgi:lysine-arginine-ornithine-binding protein
MLETLFAWRRLALAAVVVAVPVLAPAGGALADKVLLASEASFPPFSKTEADGRITGFEIDLGNAVCAAAKLDCAWVAQDFDGIIAALVAEKYDVIFSSMSITAERQASFDFSLPYYNSPTKFFARKGMTLDISAAGLKGKRVGVYGGSVQDQYLRANFPDVEAVPYEKIDQITADLIAGRIDLGFAEGLVAAEFLASADGAAYQFYGPDFYDPALGEGAGAMFRKGSDELRAKIDAGIRQVYADGTFDALAAKYFTVNVRADSLWK